MSEGTVSSPMATNAFRALVRTAGLGLAKSAASDGIRAALLSALLLPMKNAFSLLGAPADDADCIPLLWFLNGHRFCLQSRLRIDLNSRRRFAVVLGYAILSSLSASRTIWETTNRAFSLSSAGTTYQGA